MPLYTLKSKLDPTQICQTTDPGRALRSGRWAEVDFRRCEASPRAPYFHNGIAASLMDVLPHYPPDPSVFLCGVRALGSALCMDVQKCLPSADAQAKGS
jgi:hypothetical protein